MATDLGSVYQPPPPLRQDPEDTNDDAKRAEWARMQWSRDDALYRLRDRQVEESLRMLAGQQWHQYHHLAGWVDVTQWMTDEEKRWRQRPVFNRILPWWILTHARMTENPFICTFLPGPDRADAALAEVYDILYKAKWREAGMLDVWDRTAAWLIVAGRAYQQSRIDLRRGPWVPWVGKAELPVTQDDGMWAVDPETGQLVLQEVDDVPFDQEGQPLAVLHENGELEITGKPHTERRGSIVVDNLSVFEVRGERGQKPWHEQRQHRVRSYLTPEDVWELYGVECTPDVLGDAAQNSGIMERMLFGSGFFGAASALIGSELSETGQNKEGYVCVQCDWYAPNDRVEGMRETPNSPGGRLLVTTPLSGKVLQDGPRPFAFKYTSPIRCWDFIRLPGRPSGSTPQEILNSPQRAYNTGGKQILENRALCANPQQVVDQDSGLELNQVDNRPGRQYKVRLRQGVRALEWITPPSMGADVWRSQSWLADELQYLGATHNTAPTDISKDSSGALIRELRLNDDRFLGPTMRRAAEEHGRLIQDWMAMWPLVRDQEEVLHYTGDDNVARTMVLLPDLLKKQSADVVPDLESMLPEGSGERRARVYKMWQDGAFGDPLSPTALRQFHELSRFPHMRRTAQPGGIHWTTAEQENGELLQGGMPPVLDVYDDTIHLAVLQEFMAAPEFRRLDRQIQRGFWMHRQEHQAAQARKQGEAAVQAAQEAQVMTQLTSPENGKRGGGEKPPVVPASPQSGLTVGEGR